MTKRVYTYTHKSKQDDNKEEEEELMIKQVTDYKYTVHNRSKNTVYIVDVVYTGRIRWFSCECESYRYRKDCKHINAVKSYIEDKEIEARAKQIRENTNVLIAD